MMDGSSFSSLSSPFVASSPPPTHSFPLSLSLSPSSSFCLAFLGIMLGTKQITVRLHEPKRFRAEKLADRARTGSMSPTTGPYAQLAAEGASPGQGQHGRRLSGGSGYLGTVSIEFEIRFSVGRREERNVVADPSRLLASILRSVI